MKKHKIKTGSNFSKEKILELASIFGLKILLNDWNSTSRSLKLIHPIDEFNILTIHKDYLEGNAGQEIIYLTGTFQKFLMEIGERKMKKKI